MLKALKAVGIWYLMLASVPVMFILLNLYAVFLIWLTNG